MLTTVDLTEHYGEKPRAYFSKPRGDYVALLPHDAAVLELGCADGATGALALAAGKAREYVGIELFEPMAAIASERLTRVHVGDVETLRLPYPAEHFDAFIASEVMEHLVDPWAVMAKIAPLLKPGARVFASSPNICWIGNVNRLLRGDWRYEESGMMDRTHLRWFTPHTFERLFSDAGVVPDFVAPLNLPSFAERWGWRLLKGRYPHLLYHQINFHGHRAD